MKDKEYAKRYSFVHILFVFYAISFRNIQFIQFFELMIFQYK